MSAALDLYRFDGDELELIKLDGEGWVSLPSLLKPFGKRVDSAAALLDGWARTRRERLAHPFRTGVRSSSSETTLLHIDDAPLLIARLDQRGMTPEMKAKHTRYLKGCARALSEFVFGHHRDLAGIAPSVRDLLLLEPTEWKRTWHMRLQAAVCKLYRKPIKPNPRWMARFIQRFYIVTWGAAVYSGVKKINPRPRAGSLHHQHICEALRKRLDNNLEIAVLLAEQSSAKGEFWMRMLAFFQHEPMQLFLAPVPTEGK